MSNTLVHIKQKLTDAQLKVTHQRLMILDALMAMESHPTAEQLFEKLKPNSPSLSLGTVYKTLETLVDHHLIKKVSSIDSQMRYDAKLHNHNHLYLENTREIVDFEDDELAELVKNYLANKKFQNIEIKDIQIQINAEKKDLNKKIAIK